MTQTLVIDIGGTYIKYGLLTNNQLVEKNSVATPKSFADFMTCLRKISKSPALSYDNVGISMPGVIDSDKGYAYHGGALTYIKNCQISDIFQDVFKKPVTIKNDATSAILGEQTYGALEGVANGIMLVIGTGIGGGLLINGKVFEGSHFSAGEFSLIQTNQDETLSGLLAFQNSVHVLLRRYAKVINKDSVEVDGKVFFDQIDQKDPQAISLLNEYCANLGKQIVNLSMILDPEVIVIGGGISQRRSLIDYLRKAVAENIANLETQTNFKLRGPKIVQSELGNDANLFGASIIEY